jgi:hypothetical protein
LSSSLFSPVVSGIAGPTLKGLYGSAPAAPAPPPPVEYVNTRDEIGGTQSNYVTNPDGTKTLVTSKLPLTDEQQAYQDKLDSIAKDSLDWIDKLSTNYDRSQIPWLDQYLTDYQTTQVQGLDKSSADLAQNQEKVLARNGQADSTAAVKGREQQGLDYSNARQQITRDMSSIEQQARQQELGNATNLYSIATGRLDTQLGQMMDSIKTGQNFQTADAGLQQNRNLAIYNGDLTQQALKQKTQSDNFNNLAQLGMLAAYATGPQGFALYGAAKAATGK